jgi:hypothetical protein
MLSKFYFYLIGKIQYLELRLSELMRARLDRCDTSSLFYFSVVRLNILLVVLEVFTDLVKFFVLLFVDPGQGFRLFYNQRNLQACPFSYSGFKQAQKKIRVFSTASLAAIVVVSVITSLVTNLIFGGKLPGKAAAFGWLQQAWTSQSGAYARHKDPNNQNGWVNYAVKDPLIAAGDDIRISPQGATSTQTSNADFLSGTVTNSMIVGSGPASSIALGLSLGDGSDGAFDLTAGNAVGACDQANRPTIFTWVAASSTCVINTNNKAVFNFTSVNIPAGKTLTATGTVFLTLKAQGGVTVNGTINLSGTNGGNAIGVNGGVGGLGGAGASAGGYGGHGGSGASNVGYTLATGLGAKGGSQAGAGHGGAGHFTNATSIYDVADVGGSGGSGGAVAGDSTRQGGGGGGGGGSLKIIGSTIVIGATGQVLANGGSGGNSSVGCGGSWSSAGGGGSGGRIVISATNTIDNNGTVRVVGGDGGKVTQGGPGAGGRIIMQDADGVVSGAGTSLATGGGFTSYAGGCATITTYAGAGTATSVNMDIPYIGRYSAGSFISGVIDLGFRAIDNSMVWSWNQTLNGLAADSIGFQISSDAAGNLETFYGPDGLQHSDCNGVNYCYSVNAGQAVHAQHNGARYIKYKAFLKTNSELITPTIDDVSVAFQAYNQSAVLALFNFDGPIGSIASGSITVDASSNNNAGIVLHSNGTGPSYQAGKIGEAMAFDGVDDYISVPSSASLNLPTYSPVTMEAWIKTNAIGATQKIFSKGQTGNNGYGMALTATGYINIGGNGGSNFNGTIPISAGQWYHIIGVIDGANTRMYVNGQLDAATGTVNVINGSMTGQIGASWNGTYSNFFNGQIDEFALYGRALSQAEAIERFNAGNPSKVEPGRGLVSSWYNTTDLKNIIPRISWKEDANLPPGTLVKLQLRTASASSTDENGIGTTTGWYGPDNDMSQYFTSTSSACSKDFASGVVNCQIVSTTTIGDGNNDQWMQYKVTFESAGNYRAAADDINIQYVVNNPPEIQTGSFDVSQATSTGRVGINYAIYDSDADSGTAHPGFVKSSVQYWSGSGWVNASTSLVEHDTGTSTLNVSTSTFNAYSLSWDVKKEPALSALLISDLVVRLVVDDGEPANNFAYATTSIRIDTKDPAIGPTGQPLRMDSRPATGQPVIVYFDQIDDSPLYYKIGGDAALSAAEEWLPYVSSTTLDVQGLGTSSVYVRFRDGYENYSDVFRVVQDETPSNFVIRDLTNADVGKYMEFVAWKAINIFNGTFKTYQVWRGESLDDNPPAEYRLVGTTTPGQASKNYYLDENVAAGTTYYYKVAAEDMNGNVSMFSQVVNDNPDGQGGTDNTPPAISNVRVVASSTQSVTIVWDTDELASSYIGYSKSSGDYSTVVGYDTMVDRASSTGGTMGRHEVTVSGLTPSTTYYFQVRSIDPATNVGNENLDKANNDAELQFTTKPGPQISEVKVDYTQLTNTSVAVKWLTDVDSDSVVVYSVNPNLASPAEMQGLTGTTTAHEVLLTNLLPRTVYYFYVKSSRVIDGLVEEAYDKNADGNGITHYYQFETTYDQEPPSISDPSCQLTVTDGTTTPALIITATTSEPSIIHFAYGLATSTYDAEQATTTNFNIDQVVLIDNLIASTTYHFQITAQDRSANQRTRNDLFCSTGEKLATQEEVQNAYKAGQSKGNEEGIAQGRNSVQSSSGTIVIDKTDKLPPVISNARVGNLTATSAVISWVTDEEANGLVKFSSGVDIGSAGDDSLTRNHSFSLSKLEPKSTYQYYLSSADSSGNLAKSGQLSFVTPDLKKAEVELIASTTKAETQADKEALMKTVVQKAMDIVKNIAGEVSLGSLETTLISNYDTLDKLAQIIPAPVLGGEPATEISPTTVTISWKTDKPANSMVAFAPEGLYAPGKGSRGYLQLVGEPNQSATDHSVKIVGLKPDSTYHYQLRSKGKIGAEAASRDFVFRTRLEALEIIAVNTETLSKEKAKFSWLTSQETDTGLSYAPYRDGRLNPDEQKLVYDKTMTTSHEVVIDSLEAGTVYQFQVMATDKKGVKISKPISFFSTTKDDLPPEISDIQTESALSQSKEAKVQTIITWTTNEPTVSQVKFAKGVFEDEKDLVEETPLETVYSRNHTIVVTKFDIGEVYSFRVVATDSGGNQSVSSPHIILTPKQKEGVFELIINTFESTFGWLGKMK